VRRGPLHRHPGAAQASSPDDNSLDNPFVKRALLEAQLSAPKDVPLGDTTLEEMCLDSINLLTRKK